MDELTKFAKKNGFFNAYQISLKDGLGYLECLVDISRNVVEADFSDNLTNLEKNIEDPVIAKKMK